MKRKAAQERKNLLVFGWGLSLLIPLPVFLHSREHSAGTLSFLLLGCSLAILTITIFNVEKLKPFYKRWMQVAHLIGGVVTTLILALFFYLVFGTIGIVLRILRKDLLQRNWQSSAVSYWLKKEDHPFVKQNYLRQF